MIEALIFDFDGLILETESPLYEAWREVYHDHGVDLPMQAWIDVLGMPAHAVDFYAQLESWSGRAVDRAAVKAKYSSRAGDIILQQPVLPGVQETIEDARGMGLKLGVASGSRRSWVMGHLERLGLHERFDHITTAEDTQRHKPDPDPYLEIAGKLRVDPRHAIAFEDAPNGVKAAKAAGMFAVAVPTAMTATLAMPEADLRVDSLAEMPLKALIERLEFDAGAGRS